LHLLCFVKFVQEAATTKSKKADIFYKNVLNCAEEQIPKFLDALAKSGNAHAMEIISKSWNEKIKNSNQPRGDVVDNRPGISSSTHSVKKRFLIL